MPFCQANSRKSPNPESYKRSRPPLAACQPRIKPRQQPKTQPQQSAIRRFTHARLHSPLTSRCAFAQVLKTKVTISRDFCSKGEAFLRISCNFSSLESAGVNRRVVADGFFQLRRRDNRREWNFVAKQNAIAYTVLRPDISGSRLVFAFARYASAGERRSPVRGVLRTAKRNTRYEKWFLRCTDIYSVSL